MDRDDFYVGLAESRARLLEEVALAQTKVESYTRHTKAGKSVHVESYMRDVTKMSNAELFGEYKNLSSGDTSHLGAGGGSNPAEFQQKRNRLSQLVTEIRSRKDKGTWGVTAPKAPQPAAGKAPQPPAAKPNAPAAPAVPAAPETPQPKAYAGSTHKENLAAAVHANTPPSPEDVATRQAQESAARVYARAQESEKSASEALQRVVSGAGGSFFGWEHRLKTVASLARKIRDRAENRFKGSEKPWDDAENAMGDSLRYTVVAKPEKYTDMAKQAIAELEKAGHKVAKVDNFWGDKGDYYGVHADMVSPEGLKWELQFHTPDSMTRKDASHFWYDFSRDRSLPPEVRVEAKKRSAGSWQGLQRPTGWDGLGTMVNDPSDHAHIGGSAGVMDKNSIPPTPPGNEGWPVGQTVKWGGWEFRKTVDGWAYVGQA